MPLTSFAEFPGQYPAQSELAFLRGNLDVDEAAGVADRAMYELGLAGQDREKNLEEITADFMQLAQLGYDGRLHVLPSQHVTFEFILSTAEGRRPEGVSSIYRYYNLWTPGTEEESYTETELNVGPSSHVARLAIYTSLETGCDPVLHHLKKPFDSYKTKKVDVNPDNLPTQLEELEADKVAFSSRHKGYALDSIDQKAFAMQVLMDRIRGVEPKKQILSKGFMRVPKPGRRTAGGASYVGEVDLCGGQLHLGTSVGCASPLGGVGVSAGLKS